MSLLLFSSSPILLHFLPLLSSLAPSSPFLPSHFLSPLYIHLWSYIEIYSVFQAAEVKTNADRSQQRESVATGSSGAIKRQSQQQHNDSGERRSNRVSNDTRGGGGGPDTAQVTFQEPLESKSHVLISS